jgi:group II intron reverse transcriptase/maturase
MEQSKLVERLEGYRRRNNANHCYVNGDLYRLLFDRDLYIIAYNSVKSNDGAETSGADGTSLHGFCEEWITELIASMRDESYQPQPNRTTMIPKRNGKMRKLSFPNGKDKLVQEVVRIILECIYEHTFSNLSHGFRPKRSTQSAIAEVETWRGTIWLIEGDISACFDEIDHRTLETILRERINDERFIRLVNKILKAGYFDMHHICHGTKTGNAQGSCCSPILCNIYLDKLDRFMENIIEMDTSGSYRGQNPNYAKARYQYKKAVSNGNDPKTIKHLKCEMKNLPSGDTYDPKFRRVKYVRYADDFLIGLIAPKAYAVARIQYIVQFSIAKTLARKFDISTTKVFVRYGKALKVSYQNAKGKACSVSLALYKSFARKKDFFAKIKSAVKSFFFLPIYSLMNPLARVCYICGNPHSNVSMYHRKTKKKLNKPYSPIVTVMLTINRRQIPLCTLCFADVETDRFQINQLKRR